MKTKCTKTKFVLFLAILAAGFCLVLFVRNSQPYLDGKIQDTKQEFLTPITHNEQELYALAAAIREEAMDHADGLYWDPHHSTFPAELNAQLSDFLESCPVTMDTVYVGGQTQLIYPAGCCVFRCTIEDHRGVYAWVDLVYSPEYDEQVPAWYEKAEQIQPGWYISVLYGF